MHRYRIWIWPVMEVGATAISVTSHTHIYSTHLAFKTKFSALRTPFSLPLHSPNASEFLCLAHTSCSSLGHTHLLQLHHKGSAPFPFRRGSPTFITAALKRFKERPLDDVIQTQKKLQLVTKLKQILLKQPDKKISLRELSKYKKYLGLVERRRILPVLRRYPALFQIYEEEPFSKYCRLTPQAEHLHLEELQIKSQVEDLLVQNLRKFLMMSATKRILLEKIDHLATDMGLPMDFRNNLCKRYPQFFTMVETDYGPALELTAWDPALAVSVAEKKTQEEAQNPDSDLIIDRPRKFKKIDLPKGYSLSRKNRDYILKFQEMTFISPYSDGNSLEPGSMEAEKRACAVVHEVLSLTVEKKTLVDHLTHFRYAFKFPNKLRAMLLRHPEIFYVSFKGQRDSVFLREAYKGSELIEKGFLWVVQEKLRALMLMGKEHAAEVLQSSENSVDGNDESSLEEEDEDFDTIDVVDEAEYDQLDFDQFGDSGDEWSDSEGEDVRLAPKPEFSAKAKLFEASTEKELTPVALDGASRDSW